MAAQLYNRHDAHWFTRCYGNQVKTCDSLRISATQFFQGHSSSEAIHRTAIPIIPLYGQQNSVM